MIAVGTLRPILLVASAACSQPSIGSKDWVADLEAVGPIRFGMTPTRAAAAVAAPDPGLRDSSCHYWTPPIAPPGVRFMVENQTVVRADVDRPGVATLHGLQVGSPGNAVRAAFGAELSDIPHKYRWEAGWRYLTVASADSVYGLRFEVDSQIVRSYRTGLWRAVGYVEGCG